MSIAVAELRQVKGIVPQNVILMIESENFDKERFLQSLNEYMSKQEEIAEQKPTPKKFKFVSKIKEKLQIRKQIRENKIFNKIREDMICNTFGVNSKDLETYRLDYENRQEIEVSESIGDILKDSRSVYKGQEGSNARSKKEMTKSTVMTGVTLAGLALPFVATKFAFVAALTAGFATIMSAPLVAAGLAIGGLVLNKKRYNKAKVGNVADATEKHRSYISKLKEFITESNSFLELVDKDNALIMEQKKKLSKKEFKQWCDDYSKQKYKEFKDRQVDQNDETML